MEKNLICPSGAVIWNLVGSNGPKRGVGEGFLSGTMNNETKSPKEGSFYRGELRRSKEKKEN